MKLSHWENQLNEPLFISLIGVFSFASSLLFAGNFKVVVAIHLLLLVIAIILVKSVLLPLISLLLFTAPFIDTGKYYTFQLVTPEAYYFEPLPFGLFEHFGLVVSDIFAFLLLLFLVREFMVRKKKNLRIFFNQHLTLSLMISSWFLFLLFSFMASYTFSFYHEFSLVVLLQYSKLLISFMAVIYLKLTHPRQWTTFYYVVGVILVTQLTLGQFQFLSQLLLKSTASINPYSYIIPEENFFFPRIRGSFNHANDYAFMLYKLGLIFMPFVLAKKSTVSQLVLFISLFGILLSQSRTIWLSVGVVSVFLVITYKEQIQKLVNERFKNLDRTYFYTFILLLCIAVTIVFPRLYLSTFFFEENGGGSLRQQMIQEGIVVAREKIWFGYGVGTQVKMLFNKIPQGYVYSFPYPIHNFYILFLVETGLVGLILFFMPFYLLIRKLSLTFAENRSAIIYLGLIIGILIYYGFQPSNGRVDFIFLGVALGAAYNSVANKEI